MRTARIAAVVVLGLAAMVAVGCDHKVTLTFNNTTPQMRDVSVDVPFGQGADLVGLKPGEQRHTSIKIPNEDLPATVTWHSGDVSGKFSVDKKTNHKAINIEPHGSTTVDPNEEVQKKESGETAPRKIHQGEVVE